MSMTSPGLAGPRWQLPSRAHHAIARSVAVALVVALLSSTGSAWLTIRTARGTDPASPAPSALPSPVASPSGDPLSPSANTARPLTFDELIALHTSLALRGGTATVVAVASIARAASLARIDCGRSAARGATKEICTFGVLMSPGGSPGTIEVQARRSVAALFPGDGAPVTGRLAFAVDGPRLQLLGPVAAPTGGYQVSADAVAMAQADALPIGRLIAVDGWLGVLALGISCPGYPGILGTQGTASPFVRCPAGWITADDAVPDNVSLEPPGFGIPVQADAYESFAPDPLPADEHGARPPREAVYLLRHVANPEPTVGAATGWLVIGRLDAPGVAVPPTARAQQGGVVVELWLDRTTIAIGDRVTVLARVSNTGTTPVMWEAATCGTGPAPVDIDRLDAIAQQDGQSWTGNAALLKRRLLEYELAHLPFIDVDTIDVEDTGCAGMSHQEPFEPGRVVEMVVAWDAIDRPGFR